MTFNGYQFAKLFYASIATTVVLWVGCMVDGVMAGRTLSTDALAAMNITYSYRVFADAIGSLFATGASVAFAIALGRFDKERSKRCFTQGLICAVVSACVFMGVLGAIKGAYHDFMGVTGDVRAMAEAYYNWYIPCAFFDIVCAYIAAFVYADGGARKCWASGIVYVVCKLIFAFVLTPKYGTAGLGMSAIASSLPSFLVILLHFRSPSCTLKLRFGFSGGVLKETLQLGAGAGGAVLAMSVQSLILSHLASERFQAAGLAVLAAITGVTGLSAFFKCASQAAQPLVCVYSGEDNAKGVNLTILRGIKYILVLGIPTVALLVIFPQSVSWLYGIDGEGIVGDVNKAVVLSAVFLVFFAASEYWNDCFQMLGRTRLAVVMVVLRTLVLPIASAYIAVALFPERWALSFIALGSALTLLIFLPQIMGIRVVGRKQQMFDLIGSHEAASKLSEDLAAEVTRLLPAEDPRRVKIPLAAEETVMTVVDRNAPKMVHIEVTLDTTDLGEIKMVERDDGEVFDITDSDARPDSVRAYVLSCIMLDTSDRKNLTTTGYNRNILLFSEKK